MTEKLRDLQIKAGGIFEEQETIPLSFGNDRAALEEAKSGVTIWDCSHWGLLQLVGEDRFRFLHNQTTNNIEALAPGQGCDTVFVTSTGRTLDLATVYITEDAILMLVSPNRRSFLLQWMDRFIFPMDLVELSDISAKFAIFKLIGLESDALLKKIAIEPLTGQPVASHAPVNFGNISLRLAVGSGLSLPGYTVLAPVADSPQLWSELVGAGAVPLGDRAWECLRVQQGRPFPDRELTEDYNPLEAGLWHAIAFDKGCYIGQETIARLNTYKGVKQRLWGVRLNRPAVAGMPLTVAGEKVGTLTSYGEIDGESIGLAYVRTKAGGSGLAVQVGDATGELVSRPFLSHNYS
jgi:folate-binding protein YgfZ